VTVNSRSAEYCCPGESQPISHSVHLGRLANFYEGCLHCPHRHETGDTTSRQRKQVDQWTARRRDLLTFERQVIRGGYPDHLGPAQARSLATALAAELRQRKEPDPKNPVVLLASDGSALAAEIHAVVCEGLRFAGCDVVDIGFTTAPVLSAALADRSSNESRITGGLLVGSHANPTPQIALRIFGRQGQPWSVGQPSAGQSLDAIRGRHEAGVSRGVRAAGTLCREQVTGAYLERMSNFFHALRPLQFVLLTPNRYLRDYLEMLTAAVSCQNLTATADSSETDRLSPVTLGTAAGKVLTQAVVDRRADFGIWIDAVGERAHVVDEQGEPVSPHRLLAAINAKSGTECLASVASHGADAPAEKMTAEQFFESFAARIAAADDIAVAIGPEDALWFKSPLPIVDGLQLLAHLLQLLSRSDRTLSEVVAASDMTIAGATE